MSRTIEKRLPSATTESLENVLTVRWLPDTCLACIGAPPAPIFSITLETVLRFR